MDNLLPIFQIKEKRLPYFYINVNSISPVAEFNTKLNC